MLIERKKEVKKERKKERKKGLYCANIKYYRRSVDQNKIIAKIRKMER